jgi:hypothetical protein
MKRTGNPCPIVVIKITDAADNLVDLRLAYFSFADHDLSIHKARGRRPAEIHHNLEQIIFTAKNTKVFANALGQKT